MYYFLIFAFVFIYTCTNDFGIMQKLLNSEILKLIARVMIALVFLFFGVEKIVNPEKFANELLKYGFFPYKLVNLIAIILPWIEVLTGAALVFGVKIRSMATLSGLMMLAFIISVGTAMAMGLDISCGCSSSHAQNVGWQKIIENLCYLVLSVYLFVFPESKLSVKNS